MKLLSQKSYENADPEVIKTVCNGAGPKGFGWIIPDLILWVSITPAADIHDWDYHIGGTEEDRRKADLRFLLNMLFLFDLHRKASIWGWILWYWRACIGMLYYGAVRAGGRVSFNFF